MEVSGSKGANPVSLSAETGGTSSGGGGTNKIDPEGSAFESFFANTLFSNLMSQKQIFDPVKDAIDEGKDE